jgi:uncharacterized protein YdhG (YjbR/CyaY superfamily)
MAKIESVDQYLKALPKESKETFLKLRQIILSAAPKAEECVSYQMPALRQNGMLVYYAAFKNHVSLFPGSSKLIDAQFRKELGSYMTSKGTVQFPLDERLPVGLIKRIVKARVAENEEKARLK